MLWLGIYTASDWRWILDTIWGNIPTATNPPDKQSAPHQTDTDPNALPEPKGIPQPPAHGSAEPVSVKILSWNVANFGLSKNDQEIAFIANIIKDYDIAALQEVSVEQAGSQAVARLSDELNRRGSKWAYAVSGTTSGEGCERYAFVWKTSKAELFRNVWLATGQQIDQSIDREPCLARFSIKGRLITIANFHAVPASKNPQIEIKLLDDLHRLYTKENLVILGDFNLSQRDPAFDELKQSGFKPALINQKTSLRRIVEPNGNYLSQEYDNIFVENIPFVLQRSGVNDFVPKAKTLKSANEIADHLPVWCELKWK